MLPERICRLVLPKLIRDVTCMPIGRSSANSEECARYSTRMSPAVALLKPIRLEHKNRTFFGMHLHSKLLDIRPIRSQKSVSRSRKNIRFPVLPVMQNSVVKLDLQLLMACGMIHRSEKRSLIGGVGRGSSAYVRAWQSRRAVHSLAGYFPKNTRVLSVNLFGVTLRLNERLGSHDPFYESACQQVRRRN